MSETKNSSEIWAAAEARANEQRRADEMKAAEARAKEQAKEVDRRIKEAEANEKKQVDKEASERKTIVEAQSRLDKLESETRERTDAEAKREKAERERIEAQSKQKQDEAERAKEKQAEALLAKIAAEQKLAETKAGIEKQITEAGEAADAALKSAQVQREFRHAEEARLLDVNRNAYELAALNKAYGTEKDKERFEAALRTFNSLKEIFNIIKLK
jgi:colicin import membrane protein